VRERGVKAKRAPLLLEQASSKSAEPLLEQKTYVQIYMYTWYRHNSRESEKGKARGGGEREEEKERKK